MNIIKILCMDILKELINHFIKKTTKGPIFIYTQVLCFWDLDLKCGGSSHKIPHIPIWKQKSV